MLPLILDGQPLPDKKFLIYRKKYLGDLRDAFGVLFVSPFKTTGDWVNPETQKVVHNTTIRNRYNFEIRFPADKNTFTIKRHKITVKV